MTGSQKVQAGLALARKTVEVAADTGTCQITVGPGITITAACTASSDIRRHKRRAPQVPPGLT